MIIIDDYIFAKMLIRRRNKAIIEYNKLKSSKDEITREYVEYLSDYIKELNQELKEIGVR